jgi:hypothetical protein
MRLAFLAAILATVSSFAAEPPNDDLKRYLPTPAPRVPPQQQPLPTPTPTPPIPKPGPVLVPDTTPKH